jgi:hypothetical protein
LAGRLFSRLFFILPNLILCRFSRADYSYDILVLKKGKPSF